MIARFKSVPATFRRPGSAWSNTWVNVGRVAREGTARPATERARSKVDWAIVTFIEKDLLSRIRFIEEEKGESLLSIIIGLTGFEPGWRSDLI